MTIGKHSNIFYLLFFHFFFCFTYLSAQDESEDEKAEQAQYIIPEILPDPIARKAKPDRHPQKLEMPLLALKKKGEELHGIDVSHYQGRINWDEVAKDPNVSYVYLKATEGVKMIDDTYDYNFSECKRVGLKVGSYLFFRPKHSPKEQFKLFVSAAKTREQDLLPVIDAEVIKGVSVRLFQRRLLELCDLLEREYGKKPIIYTGRNFYNNYIYSNTRLRSYKFFIASYTFEEPSLNGGEDYLMWQYTASGRVKGIRGDVDQSKIMGKHLLEEILY